MKRVLVILGHPDPAPERFCRALATAYAQGATRAGHHVTTIDLAGLDFPLLRTRALFEHGAVPPALEEARAALGAADHVLLVFPLWLGDMPALLKGFLEQLMRPGVAFRYRERGIPEKLLTGKSARIVVTMGMPGFFYEWFYRAHAIKSLQRNILAFVGFEPVRRTVIGAVESGNPARGQRWLERMRVLGTAAR